MHGCKLSLGLMTALLLAGFASAEPGARKHKHQAKMPEMVQRVYAVADLVVPVDMDIQPGKTGDKKTQEKNLMDMISTMIAPASWSDQGGHGSLQYFPLGMGLVVRQTKEVHEEIADLLKNLRRLQDVEVAVELRTLSVSGDDLETLMAGQEIDLTEAVAGKTVIADEKQMMNLLKAAEELRSVNIMQAPKMTLFNGQRACIQATDMVFVWKVEKADGKVMPKHEPVEIGLKCFFRPVALTDGTTVNLGMNFAFSSLKSGSLIPLTPEQAALLSPADRYQGTVQQLPRALAELLEENAPKVFTLTLDHVIKKLPEGNTAVMYAGTREEEQSEELEVPILSAIPYLGDWFHKTLVHRETQHVLVLVTPRIIINEEEEQVFQGTSPSIPRPEGVLQPIMIPPAKYVPAPVMTVPAPIHPPVPPAPADKKELESETNESPALDEENIFSIDLIEHVLISSIELIEFVLVEQVEQVMKVIGWNPHPLPPNRVQPWTEMRMDEEICPVDHHTPVMDPIPAGNEEEEQVFQGTSPSIPRPEGVPQPALVPPAKYVPVPVMTVPAPIHPPVPPAPADSEKIESHINEFLEQPLPQPMTLAEFLYRFAMTKLDHENYRDADYYFSLVFQIFPESPLAHQSLKQSIICKQFLTAGSDFHGRSLYDAPKITETVQPSIPPSSTVVKEVIYKDCHHVSKKDLEEMSGIRVGMAMDPVRNQKACDTIKDHLLNKGRYFAGVTLEEGDKAADTRVVFKITEGPVVRVRSISFPVQENLSTRLRPRFDSSRPFLFLIPGEFNPGKADSDLVKLKEHFENDGYLEANVTREMKFSEDFQWVDLVYHVKEGPQDRVSIIQTEDRGQLTKEQATSIIQAAAAQNYKEISEDLRKVTDIGGRGRDLKVVRNIYTEFKINGMAITGPNVTVDESANTVVVNGSGSMAMPGSIHFDDNQPAKRDAGLNISWQKDMTFDGKQAVVSGDVQLLQDNLSLRCGEMACILDQTVSVKEKDNGKRATVEKIHCDKNVALVEDIRDEQKNYLKFTGLNVTRLDMDSQEGKAVGMGPGQMKLLNPGPIAEQGPKLTQIFFDGRMFTQKMNGSRLAQFHQNVRVLHFPAKRPEANMNPDWKDGFCLKCDELKVISQTKPGGKSNQILQAFKNVEFCTENIFARAQALVFDETRDLIVLEGTEQTPVTVNHRGTRTSNGRKILYNRKTGAISVE